jgi:hypothetical protein
LGMHYAARGYNTFTLPTLSFIWQLEDVPDEVFQAERTALRALTPGPGNWRLPQDLFYLSEHFGQTCSFKSIKHVALAAKLRVLTTGNLRVHELARQLESAVTLTDHLERVVKWNSWYQSSYLRVLLRADALAKAHGVNASVVYRSLSEQVGPREANARQARNILQKHLLSLLLGAESFNVNCVERIRHKIKRWGLQIPLGSLCRRLVRRLQLLQGLTTPRVQSAVFRTMWNGWATAARFQTEKPCVLGCSVRALDRIEHYACCPFARHLLIDWMGLDSRLANLAGFLLALDSMSQDHLTLMSIVVYAMHRATAHFRRAPTSSPTVVNDFLRHMCQRAVSGHRSQFVLDQATRDRHIR